jgi:hypothetical protein
MARILIAKGTKKYVVTCRGVNIKGVWIGESIYLPLIHRHSEVQVITELPLISTLYSSLMQTLQDGRSRVQVPMRWIF